MSDRRQELEDVSRSIGRTIAEAMPDGVGFALLVFDFGEGGSLAWISNGDRRGVMNALAEFMQKEGN